MDPLLCEFGQPSSLSEEQLEKMSRETSAALNVPQTNLLKQRERDYRLQPMLGYLSIGNPSTISQI